MAQDAENVKDPFNDLESRETVEAIHRLALHIIRTLGLPSSHLEDYQQELFLRLLKRRSQFRFERGSWAGYLTVVLDSLAMNLMRDHFAQKRDPRRLKSIDQVCGGDDNGPVTLGQTVEQDERRSRPDLAPEDLGELQEAVQAVLADLPPDLASVASWLGHMPIAQIARLLGMPRTTVYRARERILRRFETAGLRKFLA